MDSLEENNKPKHVPYFPEETKSIAWKKGIKIKLVFSKKSKSQDTSPIRTQQEKNKRKSANVCNIEHTIHH